MKIRLLYLNFWGGSIVAVYFEVFVSMAQKTKEYKKNGEQTG